MIDDYEFALCLTHDVDRPYKTFQAPYYAITNKDVSHLKSVASSERPYWQFEKIMAIEDELNVRSSFYFLNEKNLFRDKGPSKWIHPDNWKLYLGRYNLQDENIIEVIRKLDKNGWEVGLHGSYESYTDKERLQWEKDTLESIIEHEITGGRQHYLNIKEPDTWEYHTEIGLEYDSSIGSTTTYGFQEGYDLYRPFNGDFAVFPLTIMECAVTDPGRDSEAAWDECNRVLNEAKENNAVMTILWHLRYFNEQEFPGYCELYQRIISKAKEMDAWIGTCEEYLQMTKNS